MRKTVAPAVFVTLVSFAGALDGQAVTSSRLTSRALGDVNIIGKEDVAVSAPLQTAEFGDRGGANLVFVPQHGHDAQIVINANTSTPNVRVTDAFAGFDGTAAAIELPLHEKGYRVYARVWSKTLGKSISQVSPAFIILQDELGEPWLELGTVSGAGIAGTAEPIAFSSRSADMDAAHILRWSGTICAIDFQKVDCESNATRTLCWADNPIQGKPQLVDPADTFSAPLANGECAFGQPVAVPLTCMSYTNEWIFNIEPFAGHLWDQTNSRVKLMRLRFHPLE